MASFIRNDPAEMPDALSPDEKRRWLYDRQKALLETFLATGAITQAQFDKSLGDLSRKMGFPLPERFRDAVDGEPPAERHHS